MAPSQHCRVGNSSRVPLSPATTLGCNVCSYVTEMAFCLGATKSAEVARPFFQRLAADLSEDVNDIGLHELSVIMWAFARLQYTEAQIPETTALFQQVLKVVDERLEEFEEGDVSDLAWAYLVRATSLPLRSPQHTDPAAAYRPRVGRESYCGLAPCLSCLPCRRGCF